MLQHNVDFLGILIPVIVHERLPAGIQIGFGDFGNDIVFENRPIHCTAFQNFGTAPPGQIADQPGIVEIELRGFDQTLQQIVGIRMQIEDNSEGLQNVQPVFSLFLVDIRILRNVRNVQHLRVYFVGFPFLFMYNIFSTMFTSIGESKIPLGLLIFSSILNILMDLWMVAGLGLGVFGAAIATLIAQGISAVFSFLIFFARMRQYKTPFNRFERQELYSMLRIAVPSVLQQSTVSIGMMIVQAVVNPFGTQALAGYTATMRVENVFSLIFVSIGNAVSPYVSQNLGAKKIDRIKKGYHAALVLDLCFAAIAFVVIEALHTQISSLFLGKDGTALAYQVSGDYMRWIGYFFIFMGIKMATDGVLRGLGIMRPFLVANMVNLAIRLSVALICAPRFGIAFVWLAVPAGWLANLLISYVALRRSWPTDKMASTR